MSIAIIRTQRGVDIVLDVTNSINISDTSTLTDYPTAVGTAYADHVFRNPTEISLDGKMSNTFSYGNKGFNDSNRVEKTLELLTAIKNASEVVQIITPFGNYQNQMIVTLSNGGKYTDTLEFSIQTKELIVSRVQQTTVEIEVETPAEASDYETTSPNTEIETDSVSFGEAVGTATSYGVSFAAAGAAVGSIVPGIGTAVGALVGGIAGLITGGVSSIIVQNKEIKQEQTKTEMEVVE